MILEFCTDTIGVWTLIGNIIKILQIAIPIIIILLGTIDLGKAVMAGDDKVIKEAQKMFIKRLAYGVAIFFVVFIVRAVFGLIGSAQSKSINSDCWQAVAGYAE